MDNAFVFSPRYSSCHHTNPHNASPIWNSSARDNDPHQNDQTNMKDMDGKCSFFFPLPLVAPMRVPIQTTAGGQRSLFNAPRNFNNGNDPLTQFIIPNS